METLIAGRYPSRTPGAWEPSDARGLAAPAGRCLQKLPGGESHVVEVGRGSRRDGRRTDAVDEIDGRNAPLGIGRDQVVQPIRRDGPEDQAIGAATDAFGDLTSLRHEILVTSGLEKIQPNAEPPGFLDER